MTQTLFRPVGLLELRLIQASSYREFPPRLPTQSIFYPVLNQAYAAQIACDWNTQDAQSNYMGAVTAFTIDRDYFERFAIHTVGAASHQELWVPAEQLSEFNRHILGQIAVVAVFYGEQFSGERK